jgi:LmbE family N-acetylglucosaminyl deacetylase
MKSKLLYKKVLFFFAHPDDETLSAGATINKLRSEGVRVKIVIASKGLTSRGEHNNKKIREHIKNLTEACKVLGVTNKDLHIGDFEDNSFDSEPLIKLVKFLENILKNFKADAIFTHHKFCTNIDHKYCHEAAVIASRPINGSFIDLYSCETISSSGYSKPSKYDPNFFYKVSKKNILAKQNALKKFKFELRKFPHMRSIEFIEIHAKYRGAHIGTNFAEAFIVNNLFI